MNTVYAQVRTALVKAPKGLTARQLHSACDASGELQELVTDIHRLKAEGKIKADGMRDSQVIYRLGEWPVQGVDIDAAHQKQTAAPKPEVPAAEAKPRRTGSGLREGLFDMMDRLRDGKVDVGTAKAYAALAMTLCKSIEIQLEYERMKAADQLPGELGDMTMVPALESK